ncbi:MAG: hypothetical protein ACYC0T_08380 [Ramlibacter sp.]
MNPRRLLSTQLWSEPEEVRELDARVVIVLPEFHQAKIRDHAGQQYSITEMTDGVRLGDLRAGQLLHCVVTREFPRVLKASVIG